MVAPKITAHCQVRNEQTWVWYALMSVVDYVDEVKVWDTGSTDRTVDIIHSIHHPKIKFKKAAPTPNETALAAVRQEMIQESDGFDWMMILDGDEIWPEDSLIAVRQFLKLHWQEFDCVVTPTLNCVGDVFHISPPHAGRYHLLGRVGHYNIRFINLNIPGLHVANSPDRLLSYYDQNQIQIQDRNPRHITYLDSAYLHMTHLGRSFSRLNDKEVFWRGPKFKFELGLSLPGDFDYPKCFYLPRPQLVPSAWTRRSGWYILNAAWQTPLKLIKRRL